MSWTFQQGVQNRPGKTRYRSGTDSVLSPELIHNQTTPKSAAESPFAPSRRQVLNPQIILFVSGMQQN